MIRVKLVKDCRCKILTQRVYIVSVAVKQYSVSFRVYFENLIICIFVGKFPYPFSSQVGLQKLNSDIVFDFNSQ